MSMLSLKEEDAVNKYSCCYVAANIFIKVYTAFASAHPSYGHSLKHSASMLDASRCEMW